MYLHHDITVAVARGLRAVCCAAMMTKQKKSRNRKDNNSISGTWNFDDSWRLPLFDICSALKSFLLKISVFFWKSADYRWWLSWAWYVWLSSSSLLVRTTLIFSITDMTVISMVLFICNTHTFRCNCLFNLLTRAAIYPPSPLLSSLSLQCTSAPKKNCSYPSLILTSLLQKKNPRIDDKINRRWLIYSLSI